MSHVHVTTCTCMGYMFARAPRRRGGASAPPAPAARPPRTRASGARTRATARCARWPRAPARRRTAQTPTRTRLRHAHGGAAAAPSAARRAQGTARGVGRGRRCVSGGSGARAKKVERARLGEARLGERGLQPQARVGVVHGLREHAHAEQRARARVVVSGRVGRLAHGARELAEPEGLRRERAALLSGVLLELERDRDAHLQSRGNQEAIKS